MTLDEIDKILPIWGKFLEYTHGRLVLIFSTHIPESLLPFPKELLYEVFKLAEEQFQKMGDKRAAELMKESPGWLMWYVDDEDALLRAGKDFNDPKRRKLMITMLKDGQKNWIKTQDI